MDGAIDVMLMSVHAGDRKGGAIDVFLQCPGRGSNSRDSQKLLNACTCGDTKLSDP